ncbi:metal-dependent hydrolase [Thermobifida cellulosilytica]|uniref:Integral membrane protein n=1 Tax=Thermobifida cellulosilytica TB100 TaxID=665004 RepID=A0A147KLM2_THECS|nr:metal-dependent hydrolase [Thermobifida cellulosilytica]KUP98186.1 integral membrane protein [Thermobifida cellulosilytica TB100]
MMGFSHATTGVLVGVAVVAPVAAAAGAPATPAGLLAWALLGAGAALVPDLDHPSSTATRSQGFVTGLLSRGIRALSVAVYEFTRTPADDSGGEHRHLGHTPAFAAVVGAAVGLLCHLSWWASAVTAWFLAFIGLRALRRITRGWLRATLGSWAGAALGAFGVAALFLNAWEVRPAGWTVGLLVALGMVVHSLGDALTSSGVPLAWPFRVRGRRWAMLGAPRRLRFRTGTWPEWVVGALSLTGAAAAGYGLVA